MTGSSNSVGSNEAKFLQSKKTFIELRQSVSCGSCKELAQKPHTLGDCDHTYCFTCIKKLAGKECPQCGVCSKPDAYQPDHLVEKLIEAYLPMAVFLGLNNNETSTKSLNNDLEENQDQNLSAVLTHSSQDKGEVQKKQDKQILSKVQNGSFTHPQSRIDSSKKQGRRSLNESLNSSIISVTASKVDKRNSKGETALQIACLKKDHTKVSELIAMGANVNAQDHAGWTPLHEAVSHGAEEIVRILLENGANPNIPGGQNETPLHDAVACNRKPIVKLLLSNGADPNARNSRGFTPKELSLDDEMKEILESAAPVPTTPMADRLRQRVPITQTILVYFLNTEMKSQQLNKLARSLGFKLAMAHTAQVTHVVVCLNETAHAIKEEYPVIYSAILLGQFIVDYKWIEASQKNGHLEDPTPYELDGMLAPAPPDGTVSRSNAALQLPGLFNNCSFYLHGQFVAPAKADVAQWIKHGSGTVLSRSPNPENVSPSKKIPYHAPAAGPLAKCCYFIIYDPDAKTQPSLKYNMSHVKTLSIDWLIACIERFALIDPF